MPAKKKTSTKPAAGKKKVAPKPAPKSTPKMGNMPAGAGAPMTPSKKGQKKGGSEATG